MVSAHVRLSQSSIYRENYILQGSVLWCRFCNIKVDHEIKSIIDKHLQTLKHENNKKNANNSNHLIQRTIPSLTGNTLNEREKINIEVVEAFTFADIPLEKIEKLKPFLMKYCKNDRCGRHAVNLLFSFDNQTKLARTEFLSIVNASSISQFVMDTLHFYKIPYKNIIFFISDNASYMKLAYSHLSPFLPRMKHNCCLAHILNLIGKTWVDFKKFELVDRLVANFKTIFVYNSQRKIRWKEHLSRNNIESPTLAPLPVKTRWNSWFSFLHWIKPLYPHVITFINAEYSINHDSKAIQYLNTFCQHQNHILYVRIFICFITYNCGRLVNDLEFFKIRNKAIAPFVYSRIVSLQAFLSSGRSTPPISNELDQILAEANCDEESFAMIFSQAFSLAYEKCEKHLSHHPALSLFRAIQCFDPRFIQSNIAHHNMTDYGIIEVLHSPTDNLIQEWAIYCGLNESVEELIDLDVYWRGGNVNYDLLDSE
ncbi:transcription factor E2F6 isoform X1 [Rhizophagus irregularis DAOM 181602=DAOM 197198]|nr:transcription factor E2F6 isoform X1 [Rhizophagus irregularis DAOM 181602=DAOM 197198]